MKMSFKNYWHPTPKKWRKLGDALLGIGSLVTVGGLFYFDDLIKIYDPHELKIIIGLCFGCGAAGKFLTNFFKDDTTTNP